MIDVKTDDGKLPQRLKRMARTLKTPRRPLADLGGHWQRRVKGLMPDLPPLKAAAPGKPPGVHSSEYVHSIIYSAPADGQSLELGSSSIRARLLHKGGTIRPKRAKMLAIPIAVESYGKRPRDFQGLAFMGGGVLGRDGVALFVLKRSVTIHPHPHIEMADEDWAYFGRALQRELDDDWEAA